MNLIALISEALRVRREWGITLRQQCREILKLRFGSGQLDPWEYYFFKVFLNDYSPEEKCRFIGWRGEIRLDRLANTQATRQLANDKLAFQHLLQSQNLPLPKLLASYAAPRHNLENTAQLTDPRQLADFLCTNETWPLFVKPVHGAHGNATFRIEHKDDETLWLSTGESESISRFAERFGRTKTSGKLLQECLQPAQATERICGPRLTSVRIIIIVSPAGPKLFSAVWRVPTGSNITDNFSCGKTGNIIGDIDLQTGRIGRTVQGIGWELLLLERHPDTDALLGNLALPNWERVCELALAGALLLPGLRLQHWDIALTNRGPVILEVNVEGGMRTHQIVQQRGLLGAELLQLSTASAP